MTKPLNWVLFDRPEKKAISRGMRKRLALTTILAVAPFLNYGRPTYAACVASPSPTFICSGTSTGESIFVNNADVSTLASPAFVVTDDGVIVSGLGDQRFTDNYASTSITNNGYYGRGLSVISLGDYGPTPGAVTIYTNGTISGTAHGIYAYNRGSGDITITANGTVTGVDVTEPYGADNVIANDGIHAENFGNNLTITTGVASTVTGEHNGIDARNYGSGDLTITANGDVTGNEFDAIYARNFGENLTVTIGADASVDGAGNGIGAHNYGAGDLTVTVDGYVTGQGYDGIRAYNFGETLTVTTGAQSVVLGHDNGIDARNFGEGALNVTADGIVTGYYNDAIYARNYGTDLTITTGGESIVRGGGNGIGAFNFGSGSLSITADGLVGGYSEDGDGIHAYNSEDGQDLTIITGADSDVFGGKDGIYARNIGTGFLAITANGLVTGNGKDGINAFNSSSGTSLTITTGVGSVVTGVGDDGIDAENDGDGNLTITANGTVTGLGGNSEDDGSGIEVSNFGSGGTIINVGSAGLVQGKYAGIDAFSGGLQSISITNDGLVQNLSAESDALAIKTEGGLTHIDNNGNLIGKVLLDPDDHFDDVLNNVGFWNTANGTSDFGLGEDVVNNSGTLRAADDPTVLEHTSLTHLDFFNNNGGLITMVDGQAGDATFLSGDNPGALSYVGTNGRLAVDAELGPAGFADELNIDGNTSGTTLVHVNVVSATGANLDGIPVVVVTNGTTAEENFDLDGPLNAGFFTWDLRFDDVNNWHELYTTGVGVGAYEFAAGITGAQDLWYQSFGTLLQRQADLRALLEGSQVTPVADFAEPVEPTPTAHITPGFWLRGVGAWLKRDDEQDGFDLDRRQTIWGGMAGFDFGSESAGEAWMFGLFGGYLTSKLKFDDTNTEWKYDGPTVGAYATYMNQAFFANATVKADFLDINIDTKDLGGDDTDTDAVNIGGMLDTGYKFGHELFLEPQASLAIVHTEIDNVDVFGGTVEFDDETSVRGRLGLRLGVDHTGSNQMVYTSDVIASVWEDFSGDNNVSITDPTFGSFGASDDPGATYGDMSLGFSVAVPDGWSSFIRGNYQFGDEFEAFAGNAGVRYAW